MVHYLFNTLKSRYSSSTANRSGTEGEAEQRQWDIHIHHHKKLKADSSLSQVLLDRSKAEEY